MRRRSTCPGRVRATRAAYKTENGAKKKMTETHGLLLLVFVLDSDDELARQEALGLRRDR